MKSVSLVFEQKAFPVSGWLLTRNEAEKTFFWLALKAN